MTKRDRQLYKKSHLVGKLAVYVLSTVILNVLLYGEISILEHIGWSVFNFLYWFGTNTFSYMYEEIRHIKHKHDKI